MFLLLLLLPPAAEERNRKAHAENGNTAAAPCGAQSTLFKMNKQPGRCYPRLASITVDKAFLEALWCRPARREGKQCLSYVDRAPPGRRDRAVSFGGKS